MPVQGLTRKEIRQRVARNLMGSRYINSAPTALGTTVTLKDNLLRHAETGSWVLGTSGTINGDLTRVTSFENTAQTMTLFPPLSAPTATSHTYELSDPGYDPRAIHDAINYAIEHAVGRWYAPEESLALHGDRTTARFDVPTEFNMLSRIEYRGRVVRASVHPCDKVFDEAVDADITVSLDGEQVKRGVNSVKFVTVTDIQDGAFASDVIDSIDVSHYDTIELWIRVTTAVASGDLRLLLDDSAECASPLETLTIPALAAHTWTFVRLALANPELDTAIISIGLEYNANATANTIHLDDIAAVVHDSAQWIELGKQTWRTYRESREVVITRAAVQSIGYSLMKLVGGSNPTMLDADDDVADLPESYVCAEATAQMLQGGSLGRENDQEDRRGMSAYWGGRAGEEMRKFPPLTNVRKVGL